MHAIEDERNILPAVTAETKDCIGCARALPINCFQRDSSYRDGHRDLCDQCASSPRMSTVEHTERLREMNANSEAIKRQRWAEQETWKNDIARRGRPMTHSDFLLKLQTIAPNLYVVDGRIIGDLAVYRVFDQPQPRLDGRSFEYLFYLPTGMLPEFSIIEFNAQDVPVKEKRRGWRTALLRLIKAEIITLEQANRVFGPAIGEASYQWYRQLHEWRSARQKAA